MTGKGRRKIQLLFIWLLMVSPLVVTAAAQYAPVQNAVIVWETIGQPDSLDPHVTYDPTTQWISSNVYETLYTYDWYSDDTESLVPLLASDVTISADLMTYDITLRQGITFHDGTAFNADAVVYNLHRILAIFDEVGPAWLLAEHVMGGQDLLNAVYTNGQGSLEHYDAYNQWVSLGAITALHTYAVRIELDHRYVPFLHILAHPFASMISPTFIDTNLGIEIGVRNRFLDENTCGTGPYMVEEWIQDERIELSINSYYWRASSATAQSPNAGTIGQIIIRQQDNLNSRILNLQAGESEGCYWPTSHAYSIYNEVEGDSGDGTLKSLNPEIKVWCGEPSYSQKFIGLNMNPTINTTSGLSSNPLAIKAVRECFSYAFNYQEMIDAAANGFGLQLRGIIPQGMYAHNQVLFRYDYNLRDAAEAWNFAMINNDLDEVLSSLDYELTFYVPIGSLDYREIACLILADGLENMLSGEYAIQPSESLTINVEGLDFGDYYDLYFNKDLLIYPRSWHPDIADPDDLVTHYFHSAMSFPNLIGLGTSEYYDAPYVDTMIEVARTTEFMSDREDLYIWVQEEIIDHVAYIWCYQETNFHVESSKLNDYVYNPMREPYFYHMWITSSMPQISFPFDPLLIAGIAAAVAILVGIVIVMKLNTEPQPSEYIYG
ncbi:MAG: ABC transporter substrate-binding protein [Candidatus Thorarchaeota archaeon]